MGKSRLVQVRLQIPFLGLALLLLCGCGSDWNLMNVNFQAQAPAGANKPPAQENKLNSPLLRELKKYVQNADDLDDWGANPKDLIKSLDDADKLLTRIKLENRVALANANRQPRTMLPVRCPNIVLVVAPRMGVGDLGCYGQTKIQTPNIDALANTGVRLMNFYAGDPSTQGSFWTLHTGWMASRSRKNFLIEESTYTLAESLWQGGYHTAFYGMWMAPDNATKLDSPLEHGFDEWLGQLHAKDALTPYPKSIWVNDKQIDLPKAEKPVGVGDLIATAAIKELEQNRIPRRPLFLMIVLPPYVEMSAQFADKKLSDKTDWPIAAQSYGAAVRMTDRDLGRIQAAIERLQLTRRTSVIFTAIGGADAKQTAATDYFQSTGPYKTDASGLGEGNLRVPFLAAFPGVFPAGKQVPHPAAMWDLLPTFTELTFTFSPRKAMDGISFAPLLKIPTELPDNLLYWQRPQAKAQAVRLGQWKGLLRAGSQTLELFDLADDPGETKNVADQHPDIIQKMIKPAEPKPL